jgi:hypothetical protein
MKHSRGVRRASTQSLCPLLGTEGIDRIVCAAHIAVHSLTFAEDSMPKLELTTEQVLADATIAGQYLRALIDQKIPMQHAVSLTSSYMMAQINARTYGQEPKPPWEPDA